MWYPYWVSVTGLIPPGSSASAAAQNSGTQEPSRPGVSSPCRPSAPGSSESVAAVSAKSEPPRSASSARSALARACARWSGERQRSLKKRMWRTTSSHCGLVR